MSLICTLETYLRFKGRKWCKLNHFRFWKIKKRLNEEISESRLMDHKERQDETSWVLKMRNDHYRVRKEARKHGKWGMKQDSVAWKFRIQKYDGNIYSNFKDKFGEIIGVHFIHTIYHFEDREVRSPTLQMVCKLELKWRSYGHLKTTAPSWKWISQ